MSRLGLFVVACLWLGLAVVFAVSLWLAFLVLSPLVD
jgi:hypothetical protein